MGTKDLSILIPSFYKNADIWKFTDFFLKKYWPACPYPIYLGSNGDDRRDEVPEGWIYINKGPDRGWSESMEDFVGEIPTPYILLFLDDFLLNGQPDEVLIEKALQLCENGTAAAVHLRRKTGTAFDDDFVVCDKYDEYRASLKPCIWEKGFLESLLAYGYDPWKFEHRVGVSDEALGKTILGTKRDAIPHGHALSRGQYVTWLTEEFLEKENCPYSLEQSRRVMTEHDNYLNTRRTLKRRLHKLFDSIHPLAYLLKRRKLKGARKQAKAV